LGTKEEINRTFALEIVVGYDSTSGQTRVLNQKINLNNNYFKELKPNMNI